MIWPICLVASLAVFLLPFPILLINSYRNIEKRKYFSVLNLLVAACFIASFLLILPVNWSRYSGEAGHALRAIFIAVQNTLQVFSLDGDFDAFVEGLVNLEPALHLWYAVFGAMLHVIAPVLTLGFVLSFFKNVSAYQKYFFSFFKNCYVFSALNDRSLSLASSCLRADKRAVIIFTDVFDDNREGSYELISAAKKQGAICFKKDITAVRYNMHSKTSEFWFFAIGDDDAENILHAIELMKAYGNRKRSRLYVFSTTPASELHLNALKPEGLRARKINDAQSFVYNHIYTHSIFASAQQNGDQKDISILLLGMGRYGTELLKALVWCGQMDGYRLSITIADKDPNAASKFAALCPELMQRNHVQCEGDAFYAIEFLSGLDYASEEFAKQISELKTITSVYIALGDDLRNIDAAIYMRRLCEQNALRPNINAIVKNSIRNQTLEKHALLNYKGESYDITFIGDAAREYSYDNIVHSTLENEALRSHLAWGGKEEEFYAFEFNYRSSLATAIHRKWREELGIPEEDVPLLEKKRWNAYMRSEGYIWSGSIAPETRNDMAKLHHCLVPYDMLNDEEKAKDYRVGLARAEDRKQ